MFNPKKDNTTYKAVYLNHLHQFSAFIFIIIILIFSACTTFFVSIPERARLLQKSHDATIEFSLSMQNKSADFWKIYLPIYEDGFFSKPLSDFYENNIADLEYNPGFRQQLITTLSKIAASSEDINCLLLYRKSDDAFYLYYKNSGIFKEAPADFPFLDEIRNKQDARLLTGSKPIPSVRIQESTRQTKDTYAMAGNVFSPDKKTLLGSIAVGFDTSPLHSIYLKYRFDIPTDILVTTASGEIVYTSTGNYDEQLPSALFSCKSGDSFSFEDSSYFLETIVYSKQEYYVFNRISEDALAKASHKYTPVIWLIGLALSVFSASLHVFTGWLSARKTNIILKGVQEISHNNLDYRIPVGNSSDEFATISASINNMTKQMQDYIQKVYLYSIKQKNAELGELQAKFNPHFLYNTLEVIHSQLLQNGDDESAEMVLLLSRIFRNFISQKVFVSIREELSLCKLYLQLLELRYPDQFEISFDVDSSVLEYAIIRNLTQPILENYFVHGFSDQNSYNSISISGSIVDQDFISIKIIDNGSGISPEKIQGIRNTLSSPILVEDGSYGLKNIHDRIQTFYGADCGLSIESELGKGTTVTLLIKKLTNEQHVNRFQFPEEKISE